MHLKKLFYPAHNLEAFMSLHRKSVPSPNMSPPPPPPPPPPFLPYNNPTPPLPIPPKK